jgi:hypothetical protein
MPSDDENSYGLWSGELKINLYIPIGLSYVLGGDRTIGKLFLINPPLWKLTGPSTFDMVSKSSYSLTLLGLYVTTVALLWWSLGLRAWKKFIIQSSKWKFSFTGPNQILEFILHIYLNKNWKIYWSEQSSTGLGPEDRCLLWGLYNSLKQVTTIQCIYPTGSPRIQYCINFFYIPGRRWNIQPNSFNSLIFKR